MAEVVELHAEEMIPELELMEKMQLFDNNEIRTITKKRKEFEYKLQRKTKCKDDALRYIQYEMDLMKLIRQKRKEKGLNQKKNNLDYTIANRINKLFNFAIRRFPNDVKIWLAYIKFCKQVRSYTCASRVLDQMLELHGDKASMFKLAAQLEFEDCQCVEKARKFLLNGLHIHKDSKLLYTEAFKLELNFANLKRKEILGKLGNLKFSIEIYKPVDKFFFFVSDRGETIDSEDPVLQGKLAEVIYDSATKKIKDVTFVVDLLCIAKNYNFTDQLQKKILDNLVKKFPKEELTWDTLAKRELESSKDGDDPNSKSCTNMYECAVKSLNTEKMWTMYLDRMLELNEDTTILPNLKRNCLSKAFFGAHNQGMMSEKYYLIWVNIVYHKYTDIFCNQFDFGNKILKLDFLLLVFSTY
ncbi:hypothetical protein AAG570_013784 [Ranatra chinensis]|uniref:U3 small nucleolar RNA-associated protein 6 homolog n=1 Tax=Ranatra chinensis TaxID=642074 RepID=A0ABD0YD62_9HEMI